MKRLLRSDGIDVIVVGSGLAGLSAALTVAEFGYSPVIEGQGPRAADAHALL